MAKRIFAIGAASESEVEGVRSALREYGVEFYETPRGNYGRSMAALWIKNDTDYPRARQVIEQFQVAYRANAGAEVRRSKINWKLVPWGILLVVLLIWMLAMGYSR
jgi:hypothetical protein